MVMWKLMYGLFIMSAILTIKREKAMPNKALKAVRVAHWTAPIGACFAL
jgi:hypothetical protein